MFKKSYLIILAVILIGLFISWYLVSPLFIDKKVSEEAPVSSQDLSLIYEGNFVDADSSHRVKGIANILSVDGKNYLRLEDFESTNGPDLKVYLSNDLKAGKYKSLGDLKGNIGNQNYELSEDVDISDYKYVLIWCEPFRVLFGYAELKES